MFWRWPQDLRRMLGCQRFLDSRAHHLCKFPRVRFNEHNLRNHRDMTAFPDHLDELDRLVIAASKGMQPEDFSAGLHDAADKVKPVRNAQSGLLGCQCLLAESIVAYGKHPTPEGIGKIGNALVGCRRTAFVALSAPLARVTPQATLPRPRQTRAPRGRAGDHCLTPGPALQYRMIFSGNATPGSSVT